MSNSNSSSNQTDQTNQSDQTNTDIITQITDIIAIAFSERDKKIEQIQENQKTIDMTIHNNIKNILDKEEIQSQQTAHTDVQIQNLSKLIKYLSDDLTLITNVSELQSVKLEETLSKQTKLEEQNISKDAQIAKLTDIITETNKKLEDLTNKINSMDTIISAIVPKVGTVVSRAKPVEHAGDKPVEAPGAVKPIRIIRGPTGTLGPYETNRVDGATGAVGPYDFFDNSNTTNNNMHHSWKTIKKPFDMSYDTPLNTPFNTPLNSPPFGSQKTKTLPNPERLDAKFLQRIERSCTQNLQIELLFITENSIACQIVGTTGNLYVTNLVGKPSCTCPDYEQNRHKCKHILFVLHKLLSLDNVNRTQFTYKEIESAIEAKKLCETVSSIRG